jgi:hypothetical protein
MRLLAAYSWRCIPPPLTCVRFPFPRPFLGGGSPTVDDARPPQDESHHTRLALLYAQSVRELVPATPSPSASLAPPTYGAVFLNHIPLLSPHKSCYFFFFFDAHLYSPAGFKPGHEPGLLGKVRRLARHTHETHETHEAHGTHTHTRHETHETHDTHTMHTTHETHETRHTHTHTHETRDTRHETHETHDTYTACTPASSRY